MQLTLFNIMKLYKKGFQGDFRDKFVTASIYGDSGREDNSINEEG